PPPALMVSKTASVPLARVGETITYTYRITNTGGLTFTALSAIDDKLGPITLDRSSLGLGEVAAAEASYTVQLIDLPGPLINTFTANGLTVLNHAAVTSATASAALVHAPPRGLVVSKTASVPLARVGETITYTYRITNTGGITFTAITATDDRLGPITLNRSS